MNLDDILDQALEDFEKEFTKPNPVIKKEIPAKHISLPLQTNVIDQPKKTDTKVSSSSSSSSSSAHILKSDSIDIKKSSTISDTDKMMDDLLNQFEEAEEKEDEEEDEVIDGMMKQLLAKDLMCEPTRMLCERYPTWLAENKDKITEEQYINYEKQYITFQRLLATYDTQPDNYTRYVLFD